MLQAFQALIITLTLSTITLADVFMTELTDPQNSSDAGRYVELYNNGDSDVDLSSGWALLRWTNGNSDPQSPKSLDGTITAGGFYIICNNADKYNATYGLTCDQDIGTGGPADSNGDDNIALLDASGTIVDMFGVAGEDGSGTGHEFEDGRAERAEGASSASAVWNEADWNIDNDSGGGDGNQYAPEGFDPGAWIGESTGGGDTTCEDDAACNTGETGDCTYADEGFDCNGDCVVEVDCEGTCGGSAAVNVGWGNLQWPYSTSAQAGSPSENIYGQVYVDGVTGSANPDSGVEAELGYGAESSTPDDSWTWSSATVFGNSGNNDEFAGQLTIGDGGVYSYSYRYRYGSSCWYYASETGSITVESLQTYSVTFNVDMNHTELSDDGVAVYGLFSWGEGNAMTDEDGDGVYSTTVDLPAGDYLYKFKNGGSWENVDELDCAVLDDPDGDGWGYWDRAVSVIDADLALDTDCFGACGACAPGCTDSNATNYDENANVDDGSCEYPTVEPDNLFFSEYAEGSSNNKYLEIYNASGADVDLSGYSLSSCSNGCNDGVSWDYPDNVTFDTG
ncbi:MAG: lamin tail domain-containing protein, partial [Candidatus Marinimicrobia bacterium]|nr:lamin tail domain-containing protein [Candidatus Neomarinimicrobiota bacterium]